MDEQDEDAALVLRAQQGDREAFNRLVERHYGIVVTAAFLVLANIDASRDCAQEAFLEAARNLAKLREPAKFPQWIYGISRNKALDLLHWQKVHHAALKEKTSESRRLPPIASPPEEARKRERVERIRSLLGELPVIYREVLVLKYIDDRSHSAIAKVLGISTAAVEKRLMRGKAMLRESLGEWRDEN